ncbi:MAG TPA: hypothetical protein VGB85_03895, partial [Nannocystis sp.]
MTLISNLHSARFTSRLAAVLVALGATACTVDKNLATVSDGDTEVSSGTTDEPTSGTTSDDTTATATATATATSSSTSDGGTTATTSTTSTTDDSTTDDSTTAEPAASCPDHPTVDDCCCFEKSDIYVVNVCTAELEVLCEDAKLLCANGGGMQVDGECESAVDEALVDCALSALMGGKAGSIHINLGSADSPGMWDRDIDYHITGDGGVYRVDDTFLDLSGEYKDTGLYDLKPPEFFTACLAGSIAEKADCLREAVTGAAKDL